MSTSTIFDAVLSSDIERIRSAIAGGCALNERDELGMTPLLYAVFRGDAEAAQALLEAGADPNLAQLNDPSCTPLWHAQEDFGLKKVTRLLRAYGAHL